MVRSLTLVTTLLISACGSQSTSDVPDADIEKAAATAERAVEEPSTVPTSSTLAPETTVPETNSPAVSDAELLALAEAEWADVTAPIIGLGVASNVAVISGIPHAATTFSDVDELGSVGIWRFTDRWQNEDGVDSDMFVNIVELHLEDLTGDDSPELLVTSCPNACFSSIFRNDGAEWFEVALVDPVEIRDGRLIGEENTCQPSCSAGNLILFELVWNGSSFDVIYNTSSTPARQPTCATYTEREFAPYSLCDKGIGVQFLQRALIYFEYLDGSMDGYFGPNTDRAVRQLQRDYGVPEDGIVDGWWYQEFMETYRSYNE
jgi:hypothetical protein